MDQADPLVTLFSRFATLSLLLLTLALLILSFFFGRFWCRYLCPAGAGLALLSGLRLLPRRWRPIIQPAACGYGVRYAADLDCLCCNRCLRPETLYTEEPRGPRWLMRENGWLLAVLLSAVLFLVLLFQAPERVEFTKRSAPIRGGQIVPPKELARIRELLQQRKLSDHEAHYYHFEP